MVAAFRTRSFDDATEAGRSKERYRRAALTGITSTVSKGIRLLTSIVAVPSTVGYLGAERFGLWMSLSSLIALAFGVADLGLGSTLQNAVSTAHGKNDPEGMKRDLSSVSFVMLGAPMLLLLLFLAFEKHISWSHIFNLKSSLATHEAGPAVVLFVCCYLTAMPLGVAARVQWGLQEGVRTNAWDCVAAMLGLIGTLVAAWFHASLPTLVLASSGLPLIAMAANSVLEFVWRRPFLRPQWAWFNWRRGRQLMGIGIGFLVSSLGSLAITAAPLLATGNRFGAAQAGAYALTFKILTIPMTLFAVFWYPLWPAYADAHARGDYDWIHRTLSRSRQLILFVQAPALGALGLAVPWLVSAWTRGRLRPSFAEGGATAMFVMVVSLTTIYAIPLLACGRVRVIAIAAALVGMMAFLPLAVPASTLRLPIVPLWVSGCEAISLAVFVWEFRQLRIAMVMPAAREPEFALCDQAGPSL